MLNKSVFSLTLYDGNLIVLLYLASASRAPSLESSDAFTDILLSVKETFPLAETAPNALSTLIWFEGMISFKIKSISSEIRLQLPETLRALA